MIGYSGLMEQSTAIASSDNPPESRALPLRGALLWLTLWTSLGLFQATRLYFAYNSGEGYLISWGQSISWALADWYLWGLLSLIIIRINRQWLLPRSFRWTALGIHLVLSIIFSVVQLALYTLAYRALEGLFYHNVGSSLSSNWSYFEGIFRGKFHAAILAYFLIAMISYALESYRRLRNEEIRLARLESQLATAELEALKVQLHPHFLFNTLNSISALVHDEPDLAEKAIARLSELLRMTIESSGRAKVPLRDELDFLERYFELQQMRFGDRLVVERKLSPETFDAMVPNLILQPLIENSIRHGISQLTNGGTIELRAHEEGGNLLVTVADNGPGFANETRQEDGGGFGLRSTRERLAHLYGKAGALVVDSSSTGGTTVSIRIPFEV